MYLNINITLLKPFLLLIFRFISVIHKPLIIIHLLKHGVTVELLQKHKRNNSFKNNLEIKYRLLLNLARLFSKTGKFFYDVKQLIIQRYKACQYILVLIVLKNCYQWIYHYFSINLLS